MQSKEGNNQRTESQQLSPRDIQRNEAVYRKDLHDFILGLVQGEKYKKNTIKKLARDLEEAGTIPIHKISARIKNDLREIQKEKKLDKPLIALEYVHMVLEDKYKKRTRTKNAASSGINENFFVNSETVTTSQTLQDPPPTAAQTTATATPGPAQYMEQPPTSPQSLKEERDFSDWVESFYHLTRSLSEHITGYKEDKILKLGNDSQLISETRHYRFDAAKRLNDVDIRTFRSEARRSILLLNDFIGHIEKELDSRKNKEGLTSE